jgi:hypothetical protein
LDSKDARALAEKPHLAGFDRDSKTKIARRTKFEGTFSF